MKKLLFYLVFFLFACQNTPPAEKEAEKPAIPGVPAVGEDRDEHGCIPSAGYRWSVVKNACVRVFEVGIRLQPQDTALDQTSSAFIVFNDDQTKAELFLPRSKAAMILERKGEEGGRSWESGEWKLFPWKGYVLKEGEKTMYAGGE